MRWSKGEGYSDGEGHGHQEFCPCSNDQGYLISLKETILVLLYWSKQGMAIRLASAIHSPLILHSHSNWAHRQMMAVHTVV